MPLWRSGLSVQLSSNCVAVACLYTGLSLVISLLCVLCHAALYKPDSAAWWTNSSIYNGARRRFRSCARDPILLSLPIFKIPCNLKLHLILSVNQLRDHSISCSSVHIGCMLSCLAVTTCYIAASRSAVTSVYMTAQAALRDSEQQALQLRQQLETSQATANSRGQSCCLSSHSLL